MKFKSENFILSTVKIFHGAFFINLIFSVLLSENIFPQTLSEKKEDFIPANISISIHNPDLVLQDSIKKKNYGKTEFKMKKSPWKAVAYSAILPGAGQLYNESYWKIPIIAGLGGYFVYEWIKNNNSYLDYKQLYVDSQTPQNPSGNLQLQSLREFYRDQRDNFIIYSLILYVVNLIDAYVDAQLYDFSVSDKIKLGVLKKENLIKLSYSF